MLGKKVCNRYQITKELGSGGFGDTYLAEDQGLPGYPWCVVEHLRLKHPDPAVFPIARQLFDQEAEILYKLGKHEQIPQLIEHIQDSGDFYLVQEFVEGADLTQEIIPGKPWEEAKTIKLIREILEVLRFVHQEKIIHQDLKPDNLMRRKSDQKIVMIDFGAVKQIGTLAYNQQQRKSYFSAVVGTDGYMPHEQAAGKPHLASDVYAVGMLAIQALTGYYPTDLEKDHETLEVLWREKAPGVSKEFAQVIDKMVTNYFPPRYKNASEALNALNQISAPSNHPLLNTVVEPIYRQPQRSKRPTPAPNTMSRSRFLQLALFAGGGAGTAVVFSSLLKAQAEQTSSQNPTPTPTPETKPTPTPTNSISTWKFWQLALFAGGGALAAVVVSSLFKAQAKQTSSQNPNSTPEPKPAPTPTPSNTLGLKTFSFETVKVNSSGEIITRENKTAEYFTVDLGNGVTMDFVAIPGGSFMMGSPSTEKERDTDEGPQRLVTIKPFFMGKYPVTQAQYEAIMGNNPANFKGANRPVEKVTWDDSVNFCNKLSPKIGKECKLPTEVQWEYACRAGTTTPFYFGETITSDLANYDGNYTYGNGPKGAYRHETTEVGMFPPNSFGLFDLHGNVWEWCLDGYGRYQEGNRDGSLLNNDNTTKVLRGGSWNGNPLYCRSTNRLKDNRDNSYDIAGFRAVCLVGGT